MKTTTPICTVLLVFLAVSAARAADDVPGATARVRLIVGETAAKGYLPRLEAIRRLEDGKPLSNAERASLLAFLKSADATDGLPEMERASLKNEVAECFLLLPEASAIFARSLLEMQADTAQSATWRNYCVQFLGRVYASLADAGLRREVRDRLYLLAEAPPDAETCGTALMALASLHGHPEIDAARVAGRAIKAATDSANPEGLRFTALQAAADLGHADAAPTAREWLAREKFVNLKAVAIGILGKHGVAADRALIAPYLTHPDPRLGGAARAALKP